jgi:nucleotide-binding universal stress UspA family protein
MTKVRRILHPSDFSPGSRAAFARAVAEARAARAPLLLVHVLPTVMPLVGDGMVSARTYDDMERSLRTYGQRQLDKLVAKAKAGGARAQGLLLEGAAADAIVRTARAKRVDLIVMGTHGRGGLARLLMGSVAERVIGTAVCPVLTIRGK